MDSNRDELWKVRDELDIAEVINRYGRGIRENSLEILVSCFADDAYLDYGETEIVGIENVRTYFAQTVAPALTTKRRIPGLDTRLLSTPIVTNVMIDLDDDEAHAESICLAVHVGVKNDAEVVVVRGICNSDDFVRTASSWKIKKRVHTALWTFQTPGLMLGGH
jgi:hypothetical protein